MEKIKNLFLYRYFLYPKLFKNFTDCINNSQSLYTDTIGQLTNIASEYGFEGNIWQCYLTLELMANENSFSLSRENGEHEHDSVYDFALSDIEYFFELFQTDLSKIFPKKYASLLQQFTDFTNKTVYTKLSREVNHELLHLKKSLSNAVNSQEFLSVLSEYYIKYGCGTLSLYGAFRMNSTRKSHRLTPILNPQKSTFAQLVGYEMQKKELIQNTQNFINGSGFSNVLLFGESGTGKSTSIRAILHEFSGQKIKMIEMYKNQIHLLSDLISDFKNRGYKFIVYMDDLSFEDYETEYKYLKAVIEGGLEMRPQNVALYATSNRRHLIREQWSDRMEQYASDDVHSTDTMEEKLSLVSRFGVTIYFPSPNNVEFKNIVTTLAKENQINLPEDELLKQARRWELRHGGLSGRVAKQFIDYLSANE